MLYHIIRFAFADDAPADQRDEVVRQMERFSEIDGVIDARVGQEVAAPDDGFTHALVVTLEGEAQYEPYQAHPLHISAAAFGLPFLSKMQSVDIVMDPTPGVGERLLEIGQRVTAEKLSDLTAHTAQITS